MHISIAIVSTQLNSFNYCYQTRNILFNINDMLPHCLMVLSIAVVYWPSTRQNMPFQSDAAEGSDTFRWQLWEEIALAGLDDNMGQGKIPCYSHRLIHRKRVTCELYDSYFRLMTIKHAIPEILSGWLNYYITRWRQEVS